MSVVAPGHELLGRYRLGRKIGSGGMGSIFIAHDIALGRPVAVKFMSSRFVDQTDLRARFEREARTAAGLRSAHIVEVFDVGTVDDVPFIVMELLEGEDLGVRMRATRMSVDAVLSVVLQAARGLEVAHRAGVVHRDIKPANLFLARQGESEVVKVLDFGIAKSPVSIGESTLTDEPLGSPHYMSPEQAKGAARVDSRADVWSLGVVAYRLLAGVPPFDGPGAGAIFVALCTEPHPVISQIRPDLPVGIDAFFDRALAKHPGGRFPSAMALAAALASALGHSGSTLTFDPSPSASSASAPPTPIASLSPRRPEVDGTLTEVVSPVFPKPRRRRAQWWVASAVLAGAVMGGVAAVRMRASESSAANRNQLDPAEVGETAFAPESTAPTSSVDLRSTAAQVEVTVASADPPTSSAAATTVAPSKPRPVASAPATTASPPVTTAPSLPPPVRTAVPTASAEAPRIKLGI